LASSIRIDNINAGYGAVRVLHNVSLNVGARETVTLLGTNGNGKSTLIKTIMGVVRPSSGRIVATIDGTDHDLIGKETEEIVDLGVALVPEGRRLFPRLTVEENLLLGAYRPTARARLKDNMAYCYEAFPRLAERRAQLAGTMSGGEQQMLALARALMSAPSILIVDEPSVGLAPLFVGRTIDMIAQLKERYHLTVLMAEQNFTQAMRIADKGYVIVHGEIAFRGESPEEMRQSDLIRQHYLGM
jgi:branched-chain amino acid transport system ATP-binding protein